MSVTTDLRVQSNRQLRMARHHMAGTTMIEVLVTMLILGVGLLGLSLLQMTSLKEGLDTAQRSHGIWIAQEIIERMRANPNGLSTGYTAAAAQGQGLCAGGPAQMCSDHNTGSAKVNAAACTAVNMAEFDLWEVMCGYDNGDDANGSRIVSNGSDNIVIDSLSITCTGGATCPAGSDFTIQLQWTAKAVADATADTADFNEDATQQFAVTVRP